MSRKDFILQYVKLMFFFQGYEKADMAAGMFNAKMKAKMKAEK